MKSNHEHKFNLLCSVAKQLLTLFLQQQLRQLNDDDRGDVPLKSTYTQSSLASTSYFAFMCRLYIDCRPVPPLALMLPSPAVALTKYNS